jgi:hypothetical protein
VRRRFADFFFAEESVRGVVYFRVALSVWTMGLLALRLPYINEIHVDNPLRQPVREMAEIAIPLWGYWGFYALAYLLLVLFAIGWQTRVVHSLFLLVSVVLIGSDVTLLRAYGVLGWTQWVLLYAAPYDLPASARAPAWGTRLLQMQFSAVYLFTVLAKLVDGAGWLDGLTLYWCLHNPLWVRDWVGWFPVPRGLTQVLGWGTLATEVFIGIGLHFERTRRVAIVACLLFHAGIQSMMRIPLLFPTVMWIHLVLFVKWSGTGSQETQETEKKNTTASPS